MQTETIFPSPSAVLWTDAPIGAYCLLEDGERVVKTVKFSQNEARCLLTGKRVQIMDGDRRIVAWLRFPQWHVRCHEAGHLVFGIGMGPQKYLEDGISFNPYDGSAVETGRWKNWDPESQIRLSLAGILMQIQLADYSFNPALLPILRKSVIIDEVNPAPPGFPLTDIPSSGSAQTDFASAKQAARQLCAVSDHRSVNAVLREQEEALKKIVMARNFVSRVKLIAEDADKWLQGQGRTHWEEAILYPGGLGAFYPNERARSALARI